MKANRVLSLAFVGLFVLVLPGVARQATTQQALTKEQIREFLLTAPVIESRQIGRGVTGAMRLTLSDGELTHDTAFQSINERVPMRTFEDGRREVNFVDSYLFNLAAYALAEVLDLDHMMPVHVEYRWNRRNGALSWWVDDVMFEEGERLRRGIQPPDPQAWNEQMFRMRVFAQLVYDTDRNLGNVLIDTSWKLWMIDFTRAFRRYDALPSPGDLVRIDRDLLDRLRHLTREEVDAATRRYLSRWEIDAVMNRRELIVAHFDELIAERGEAAVLY